MMSDSKSKIHQDRAESHHKSLILVIFCKITACGENDKTIPLFLLHQSNASRKVQSNMVHLFRSSEEYDERIDDE